MALLRQGWDIPAVVTLRREATFIAAARRTTSNYSGNCATSTDPAGKKRELCSNALGEATKVIEDPGGLNYETDYAYDALGNLTQVTQGVQTRTYTYDMLSRLTSATTPESGTTTYSYSASGSPCSGDPSNVCTRTDARGITTTYSYDALNRLTSKSYSDNTPVANFWYDANHATFTGWSVNGLTNTKGRLYATCTSNAVLTCAAGYTGTVYSYDSMGRIVNYWQATPYNDGSSAWEMSYNYDLAGDVTSWTHPAGFTITNTINGAQEITQIESSLVDANHPQYLAKNITYTPWGAESTLENGCASASGQETGCMDMLETYVYNNRMQPVMIELGDTSNAAADYCLVYNYYAGGANPTSCATPAQGTNDNGDVAGVFDQDNADSSLSHTEAYTYDGVNRLETAVATGNATYNLNFTYDRYGNMQCNQQPSSGLCGQWGVNTSNNQLTNAGYTYGAAGDLTSDGTSTYQYDGEGRLASMNNGTTESYVYNALGAKARIAIQGSPADLFSDPAGAMLGNNGVWSVLWPIAGHAGDIYFQGSDAEFYHADGTHSTRMVTSTAGAVSEQVLFYPWGQAWEHPGWGGWNFASIPWYDTTGGLNLAAHRDYSFGLGRWLTPDPAGRAAVDLSNPQSWNAYSYAGNNPTTFTDPSGETYRVCQTDENGNQTNCTNISDAQFGQFEEENAKTLEFTGSGVIAQNGTEIGTFQQTSVDLSPDAALIFHSAGASATAQIKGFAIAVGITATTEFGGEFLGAALEGAEAAEGTEAGIATGAKSDYVDVTRPSALEPNRLTNVRAQEFGDNLQAQGFKKSVQGDLRVYTKGGTEYDVYPHAGSTGGPTAQMKVAGKVVLKIRLQP